MDKARKTPRVAMDEIDRSLVGLLQEDCRLSYAELGREVGLSISAVNDRVKKLQASGILKRYVALVDSEKLGYFVSAFVQVLIDTPDHEPMFVDHMRNAPEVLECHCITGEYGYLLKVRTRTPEHLERVLKEKVKSAPGVVRTHSLVVLSSHKDTTAIEVTENSNGR